MFISIFFFLLLLLLRVYCFLFFSFSRVYGEYYQQFTLNLSSFTSSSSFFIFISLSPSIYFVVSDQGLFLISEFVYVRILTQFSANLSVISTDWINLCIPSFQVCLFFFFFFITFFFITTTIIIITITVMIWSCSNRFLLWILPRQVASCYASSCLTLAIYFFSYLFSLSDSLSLLPFWSFFLSF